VGNDHRVEKGVEYGLALDELSGHTELDTFAKFLKSREFTQALLARFSTPDSWEGHGPAIPVEKHCYFSDEKVNYTTVLDVHKDLPGYAIAPHRDVDSKIITFLYYLEPDEALAQWGTLLCRPKAGLSLDDVESAPPLKGHPKWRDWCLFDVVKTARATPNTLLVFAPNYASYHAVNMDVPRGHLRRERTVIRGFIRAGSNKKNFIDRFESKAIESNIVDRARRKTRKIARKITTRLEDKELIAKRYDAIVVSYGGAGTTMLLEFLAPHMRVNSHNSFVDGIKHINSPDHPVLRHKKIKRAIYLVTDPREATLSLFRRNYALRMMAKLHAQHGNADDYRRFIDNYRPDVESLDDFLQLGEDLFGFKKHWRQWHENAAPFPVLFIRYDALHDSLEEILQFLGLPGNLKNSFPAKKPRTTCLSELIFEDRQRLDRIYGNLAIEIAESPNLVARYNPR
jgi:hypothetical protein